MFGQNQSYVLETLRAEGTSPWCTCTHDEVAPGSGPHPECVTRYHTLDFGFTLAPAAAG